MEHPELQSPENEDYGEEDAAVYEGEFPDADTSDATAIDADEDPKSQNLEDMKKRLEELEDEAGALREMQAKVEQEMGMPQESTSANPTQAEKEEVDSRSIYVGNVDYACTPEEVQQHFQSCGTVNRVTILTDRFGQPKGFAYVEFVEVEAVQHAVLLTETELHGRQLKVSAKRTNVPGMKQFRGRRPSPYGSRPRRPFMPGAPVFSAYGYGRTPRLRPPMRYRPY
ncbi:polyadenylate-binding protein 1 isoform X3 [Spinacia oleracea]|uniref:Polyadenylate-binding protein 1 isoform X3 n=1 Tax=Spinacia oleracea TaxID=3562 RepID=A0A9R0JVI1_SPIOL|nr:polyadenylate-binding protein 1 isoform X3 [Spinacia oleracea]